MMPRISATAPRAFGYFGFEVGHHHSDRATWPTFRYCRIGEERARRLGQPGGASTHVGLVIVTIQLSQLAASFRVAREIDRLRQKAS